MPSIAPQPTDETLFPGFDPPEPAPEIQLSPGQRLTKRQSDDIAVGRHPLTRGPLHPLASRNRDATSPKDDPFTCGSCYFRQLFGWHSRSYPKCAVPGPVRDYRRQPDGTWKWETVEGAPRASHSTTSDVRAWWPACTDYSPGSSISPDAARGIPGGAA